MLTSAYSASAVLTGPKYGPVVLQQSGGGVSAQLQPFFKGDKGDPQDEAVVRLMVQEIVSEVLTGGMDWPQEFQQLTNF